MKILIPIDGSVPALDAVVHALRMVQDGLRAEFVLANVQQPATFYELLTARDSDLVERASAEAGLHLLEPAAALCRTAGVEFELEVALGDAANTLNDIVERFECDAVVMGARGHGAVATALLGSVSQKTVHDARVPVTIVKQAALRELAPAPSEEDGAQEADDIDAALEPSEAPPYRLSPDAAAPPFTQAAGD